MNSPIINWNQCVLLAGFLILPKKVSVVVVAVSKISYLLASISSAHSLLVSSISIINNI